MLRFAATLLCGMISFSIFAAEPETKNRLRVLTYNLHHCEGTDGKLDMKRIADIIKATQPDVVALQEIDRKVKRSNQIDQPAELAKLTGMKAEFAKAIDLQGGEYGQVVLSRFPMKAVKTHILPKKEGQETRIALETRIEPTNGLPAFTFLTTHLQHDDPKIRLEQATTINDHFAKQDGPALIAGDFNATPESDVMQEIGKVWKSATPPGKGHLTSPSDKPRNQIDFILFRPAERFRVVETKVIDEKVASDHRPVLAVLEWIAPSTN
jgi:endonuclease/exonuclease/phosphatase family metal-dependent hydrolase